MTARQASAGRWHGLVVAAMAGHAITTCLLALARYQGLHNRTFDLALYGRMAWGMVHGQLGDPIVGGHALSGHVPLVLWPLGLLGRAFGTVPVLLVAQSLAVAAAAWPLYRLATRRVGPRAGVIVALSWLAYPNLGHVATYEMHPGTLAVYPLCAAFDALDRRRAGSFALWCLAALCCRASLALTTAMLGGLWMWQAMTGARLAAAGAAAASERSSMTRAGAGVALASLAYLAAVQLWLTPRSGVAVAASLDLHFGRWGGSPSGVAAALLQRPGEVFAHFATWQRLSYLVRVLAPLAFLPLLRPRLLLCAAPTLALNLISEFPTTTKLYSHYLTPAVPALLAAAVDGLARLPPRPLAGACIQRLVGVRSPRAFGVLALSVCGLAASAVGGGLPWSLDHVSSDFRVDERSRAEAALVRTIPAHASIQAPDRVLPHVCERPAVHRAPPPERGTQFVMLDVSHRRRFARREDLLRTIEEPLMRAWLSRSDHGVRGAAGDLLLLQRGEHPRGGVARRYFAPVPLTGAGVRPTGLTACLSVVRAELQAELVLELLAHDACPADLALRWGSRPAPARVDLLFDGLLSPQNLQRGDQLRSHHAVTWQERQRLLAAGLHVGVLRADGKPPGRDDPISVPMRLSGASLPTHPAGRPSLRPEVP